MAKSESRANSLLALRALVWWGGVGGWVGRWSGRSGEEIRYTEC